MPFLDSIGFLGPDVLHAHCVQLTEDDCLILARNPGHGAFRRLIAGITATKLTPLIIAPTRELQATLRRWGWKHRNRGYGLELEEIWRPAASV